MFLTAAFTAIAAKTVVEIIGSSLIIAGGMCTSIYKIQKENQER